MNSSNTWILSYPRSGNHLVRYFVEIMTKRVTLGCIGNEKHDTPICCRPGIEYLDIVLKECPVARKSHSASEIKNASNVLFILRNPIDTLVSHHFKDDSSQVLTKNTAKKGIVDFEKNLNFYDAFRGKKAIVKYEDLVSHSHHLNEKAITAIANMFDVGDESVSSTLQNYERYRSDSLKSPHRKPQSVDELGTQKLSRSDSLRQNFPEVYRSLILDADCLLKHSIVVEQYQDQLEII